MNVDERTMDAAAELLAARTERDHWRAAARRSTAEFEALRRRPLVRVAVGVERRASPVARALHVRWGRTVAKLSRLRLVAAALPHRPRIAWRRRALGDVLAGLPPPPPLRRSVTVIVAGAAAPHAQIDSTGAVDVVELETNDVSTVAAMSAAASRSCADLLCFVPATSRPFEAGWLHRLAAAVGDGVSAAGPVLVHPLRAGRGRTPHDLAVREAGLRVVVDDDAPDVEAQHAGEAVGRSPVPATVDAVSGSCLLVDRRAYELAGGLAPTRSLEVAAIDLCLRLRRAGGDVVVVPGALVADHRPVTSSSSLRRPLGPNQRRALVKRCGSDLRRTRSPAAHIRFALTVSAPSTKAAPRWGDWHLASALAESLRRCGHEVLVQSVRDAERLAVRSCDVHIALRGLSPVRRTNGQRHVLWIISHPEAVDAHECDEADLVLVASHRFAAELRQRTATPVEVFLQATDHRRFRPRPPDPEHQHPVTVVARSRGVLRPVVADAIAAGFRPAIYGAGWAGLIDDDLVVAEHVPNVDLPIVYSSAGVVLNDHWDTMRVWGFVSNRLFDVLACGVPVVSDHVPEVADVFGDAVPTYRTPEELRALLVAMVDDPDGARRRAAAGRRAVLRAHTFDHRAAEVLELLSAHGLVRAVGSSPTGPG